MAFGVLAQKTICFSGDNSSICKKVQEEFPHIYHISLLECHKHKNKASLYSYITSIYDILKEGAGSILPAHAEKSHHV
jgi:hypothetical protein